MSKIRHRKAVGGGPPKIPSKQGVNQMEPINTVGNSQAFTSLTKTDRGKQSEGFVDTLKRFTDQVNRQLNESDSQMQELALGKRNDLHEVVVATEKADLSFNLLVQVRNKLLDAYQAIMNTQM